MKRDDALVAEERFEQFKKLLSDELKSFSKQNPKLGELVSKLKIGYEQAYFNIERKNLLINDLLLKVDAPIAVYGFGFFDPQTIQPGWTSERHYRLGMDVFNPALMPLAKSMGEKYEALKYGTMKITAHF